MLILLFTNETTDICVNKLQNPVTSVNGTSKNDFSDFLNLTTKESVFTLNNKFYIQLDGVF